MAAYQKRSMTRQPKGLLRIKRFSKEGKEGLVLPKPEMSYGKREKLLKYKALALGLAGAAALSFSYSGMNLWRMHVWDKYVTKQVEIAANVPSVAQEQGNHDLSMESALRQAQQHITVSPLPNPAIIWKTPLTEVGELQDLFDKAVQRCREIYHLEESFREGKVKPNYPDWVKQAQATLHIPSLVAHLSVEEREQIKAILPSLEQLAQSEYGQRVGSEYENLNSIVGGGTRTTAKNLEEHHRSLLETLELAGGWRSIIRFQADDFKETYAHVFIGYLQANMGYLKEALEHFQRAKERLADYDDDKNMAIFRNTPNLELSTMKGLIDSSIRELSKLEKDPAKYSTGWWKRLRYYNRSIGGQEDPSINDVAEAIYDRYRTRWWFSGALGLGLLYFAGWYAKRYRKMREYQVLHDEAKEV